MDAGSRRESATKQNLERGCTPGPPSCLVFASCRLCRGQEQRKFLGDEKSEMKIAW
jgi:hypothetical protein